MRRLHTKRKFEEVDSTAVDPWGGPISFKPIAPPAAVVEEAEVAVVPTVDSKPFKCDKVGCDKIYGTKNHLQAHVRIYHLGQKRPPPSKKHICTVCSHACKSPSELVRHMRVHTKEKPYECTTCKEAFANPDHVRKHRLRYHADQESDEVCALRERENANFRLRYAADETFRLMKNLRRRVRHAFRAMGISKSCPTETLLGLAPGEVVVYLDKNPHGYKSSDPGIVQDHIRPFKDFAHSIKCPVVQREVCSYLNLQLLTEAANNEKGGKYTVEDAAAFKASEAGIKLAAKRLQWIAEGVCPGCEYCKE